MNMIFSESSNVTLVITSCNRFKLLRETLDSFEKNNTYPIKEVIIIEDSGYEEIKNIIPNSWLDHTKILINKVNLGQIKSIDLAYSHVKTDYIFHCEDDWFFYRKGFIEDSLQILEADQSVLTVWLRDIEKDVIKHYQYHSVSNKNNINSIEFYTLESTSSQWRGFTFNPTLKRMEDYKKVSTYMRPYMKAIEVESFLSQFYELMGMRTAILGCSAVKHIGWDEHITTEEERQIHSQKKQAKARYKKKLKRNYSLIGFFVGLIIGFILTKL